MPAAAAFWTLALLLLAPLAHAPALPLAAWPALALALASRRLPARAWASGLRLAGLALAAVAAGLTFGWLEAATLRVVLLLVLALKWAESRSEREHALVGSAAVVAVAIGLLQWSEAVGLALALAAALLLVAGRAGGGAWAGLRQAARHLVLALPLGAVLFVFFPRIPGPLWDIGLSFGLPLSLGFEQSNQGLGVSARLKPGQRQAGAGAQAAAPILVAEFRDWVPPTSQLYWRGPVFYDFDGQEWRLEAPYAAGAGREIMRAGWRSGAAFGRSLRETGQEVHYRIRLSPHGALWLYGLDLPSRLTAESFVGPDWQLLSHTPVREEISYELASWLNWTAGGELAPELRSRALALPPAANPRLVVRGRELAHESNTDAIVRTALTELTDGGYRVSDRFAAPAGEHALDAFWFDSREGNAELYAGAFVVLMRAAGVPARLVTGYRGGKLMALTDYVVVKKSHAHAWTEVWDEARGWRRVDPVDAIAPERFAGAPAREKPAPRPVQQGATPHAPQGAAAAGSPVAAAAAPRPAVAEGWSLPEVSAFLARWSLRLNAERQSRLIGGKGGGFAWLWLLAAAALASAIVLGAGLLAARLREHRHQPPPERAWRRACRLLAKKGLAAAADECPSRFAERVAAARPAWASAMAELGRAYADWRYGPAPQAAAPAVAPAARHLINRILAQ